MKIQIDSPFETNSGYGYRAKDFIKHFIDLYGIDNEIKLKSLPWGSSDKIISKDYKEYKTEVDIDSDLYIHIGIPSETFPKGKRNILITAGIETNKIKEDWVIGCNRMDLILVSAEHSKKVFKDCGVETEVKTLFEVVNNQYFENNFERTILSDNLDKVDSDYIYLFIGQWLHGDIGHDRKDIGMLIKTFEDTFKDVKNKPYLLLKTYMLNNSEMDLYNVKQKINSIKQPDTNVILLHAELTDNQIIELYNHNKIKSFVSFTKGEGWGRDFAQFSTVGKPIICPDFGGHTDFLNNVVWLFGEHKPIHPSTHMNRYTNNDATWLNVNYDMAKMTMLDTFNNYSNYLKEANLQKEFIGNFNEDKYKELIKITFNEFI